MQIKLIGAAQVVGINQRICRAGGNPVHCFGVGKVESALHSAFYPGTAPFQHGRLTTIAGALCYYLVQAHAFADGNKRTAVVASTAFMALNGLKLVYPIDGKANTNALAEIVERCGASQVAKEDLMDWFDRHKQRG